MIIVIADDITGAAEMAGIAHRYGLRALLVTDTMEGTAAEYEGFDVVVIATDARSCQAQEGTLLTLRAVRSVCRVVDGFGTRHHLFRKTDSALRGNVEQELEAMLSASTYSSALYMPANPSKGRIISGGVYYLRSSEEERAGSLGTPISDTAFRYDPEFPALTSSVSERFPSLQCYDAVSKADVDTLVSQALSESGKMLLAGAADLFSSLIEQVYSLPPCPPKSFCGIGQGKSLLVVCGSTQSKPLAVPLMVESMPVGVFYEEECAASWTRAVSRRYVEENTRRTQQIHGTILTIGSKEVRKGKHAAVYLRSVMSEVCCSLLTLSLPDELIVEGGATAFAILREMPCTAFRVTEEVAPGVVRMVPEGQGVSSADSILHITLKPGSYEWGELWKEA